MRNVFEWVGQVIGCLENQTEKFQVGTIARQSICHDPELGNPMKKIVSLG